MQFGFYLPNSDPPRAQRVVQLYEQIFDMCEWGESLGYSCCVASEHHGLENGFIPSPLVELAAIGARTTTLELTTGIMLLPLWHPIRVAEDGAMIDIMSHGRFSIGAGLGLVDREFDMYELDVKRAPSRLEEAVDVLRLAWTQERFSYEGRHFRLRDVSVTPKPVQACPAIRLGGMADKSVERAGRIADGWVSDNLHGLDAIRRWAGIYRSGAEQAGRFPWVQLMRSVWITDGDVYEEWGRYLEEHWRFYLGLKAGRFNAAVEPWLQGLAPDDMTFDRLRPDRLIVGTVEQVRDEIGYWIEEIQPDQFNLVFRQPYGAASDHNRAKEVMEIFAREIMPLYSTSLAAS